MIIPLKGFVREYLLLCILDAKTSDCIKSFPSTTATIGDSFIFSHSWWGLKLKVLSIIVTPQECNCKTYCLNS